MVKKLLIGLAIVLLAIIICFIVCWGIVSFIHTAS